MNHFVFNTILLSVDGELQHSFAVPLRVHLGLPTVLQRIQPTPSFTQNKTSVYSNDSTTDISVLCDSDRIPPGIWDKSNNSGSSSVRVHIYWNVLLLCSLYTSL